MQNCSVALVSQKGGVGKTTVALNLGLALAQLGKQTTILEVDPQGSLGSSLLQPLAAHSGLAQIMAGTTTVAEARLQTKISGLSLLPAGEVDPFAVPRFDDLLREAGGLSRILDELHGSGSEIVLVDCPSGLGAISLATLSSVSHALVPLQTEPLSLRSVELVLAGLERIRDSSNPHLTLLGLVLCMFDRGSEASLSVVQAAWQHFDPKVLLEVVVPRSHAYLEASLHGVPVAFMAKGRHPEGRRFTMLAQEVLDRLLPKEEEAPDGGPTQTLL